MLFLCCPCKSSTTSGRAAAGLGERRPTCIQPHRGRQHQGQVQGLAAPVPFSCRFCLCPRTTETGHAGPHSAWKVEEETLCHQGQGNPGHRRGNYSKKASWEPFPSVQPLKREGRTGCLGMSWYPVPLLGSLGPAPRGKDLVDLPFPPPQCRTSFGPG